ncbi:MAG: DUF2079 domain-containing protein [Candidatus Alcyoniella australis]|nr:DUF2079 domain-containing protein [Candidatus Alcyoniella australis]
MIDQRTRGVAISELALFTQTHNNILLRGAMLNSEEGNHNAFHVSPIIWPLSLIYCCRPSPDTLLVLNVLLIALGGVLLYGLALRELEGPLLALLAALVFFCWPAVHGLALSGYHPLVAAVPLLICFLRSISAQRLRPLAIFASFTLLLAVREDLALTTTAIGLWLLLARKKRFWGALILGVWLCWLVLSTQVIMPDYQRRVDRTQILKQDEHRRRYDFLVHGRIQGSLLNKPRSGSYMLGLFGGLGFVPLGSPAVAALSLPTLGLNLLSWYPGQRWLASHYSAAAVPVLAVAFVFTLKRRGSRRRLLLLLLAMVVALGTAAWSAQGPQKLYNPQQRYHRTWLDWPELSRPQAEYCRRTMAAAVQTCNRTMVSGSVAVLSDGEVSFVNSFNARLLAANPGIDCLILDQHNFPEWALAHEFEPRITDSIAKRFDLVNASRDQRILWFHRKQLHR